MKLNHPPGLYTLFLVEMWERFGFYVMAALFVLYMKDEKNGHPFLQVNSSLIYGTYLGLVYFTPFPGGVWADRQLGYRWAIILGAIVMGLGYVLMAFDALFFFFAGIACVVIGNGLFKPNISTLVGNLYPPNDPRLDNAYTIFYMGINLGEFTAPLVAGIVRVYFGYHIAFGIAGVGMAISLLLFFLLEKTLVLTRQGQTQAATPAPSEAFAKLDENAAIQGRPRPPVPAETPAPVVADAVPPAVQRDRHIALLLVFILVALFWLAFKQNGNTLSLWFKDSTDRTAPAWMPAALLDKEGYITTEYVSSINPLFVILFSPLLVLLWGALRSAKMEPSTPAKIGLAMLLTAAAFGILGMGGLVGGNTGRVSPAYIFGAYAVVTLAELCLSPIGLSLVTKLAARDQRSMWMGGWFAATAIGGYGSGLIGHYWDSWPHSTFFFVLVGTSLFAFVLLLLFYNRLVAAMPTPRTVT